MIGAEGDGGTATNVAGVPVQLASNQGGTLNTALIVLAVTLLVGVTLVPPLIARALAQRRQPW